MLTVLALTDADNGSPSEDTPAVSLFWLSVFRLFASRVVFFQRVLLAAALYLLFPCLASLQLMAAIESIGVLTRRPIVRISKGQNS